MNKSPEITLPAIPIEAVNLILEGLSMLPLGRSRAVFDFVASNAEKQMKEQEANAPAEK